LIKIRPLIELVAKEKPLGKKKYTIGRQKHSKTMKKTQIAGLKLQMNHNHSIWLINGPDLIGRYGIGASPRIGAQDIADERSSISHRRVAMEDLQRGVGFYILR